jgi:NitT/TauT family transport system permease protein
MLFHFSNRSLTQLSMLCFLGLWQGFAFYLHNPLLPSPVVVADVLWQEILSGQLPHHLGITVRRLIISFFIAMFLGSTIGIVLGRHEKLNAFFDSWLMTFLNLPLIVTIMLCFVWFGLNESVAILAVVVNKVPNVIITFREAARVLNRDLLEMAYCYRFGRWKTFRHVIWPQLHPFAMSATRSGLTLVWKIIMVVELLGCSDGMGFQLQSFFQLFDVASILAYTVAFVTVIQVIELLILKPLDRNAQRWRR